MHLRHGLNPHQQPATFTPIDPHRPPFRLVHSAPSYINILDALNSWQLVRTAAAVLGRPAAASFKHVSPAGAALSGGIDEVTAACHGLDPGSIGALTSAYARARDADPRASYGDFVAVSEPVDAELADLLRRSVSDGIIAPGYAPGVVNTLQRKKNGAFLILEADPDVDPPAEEAREVHGVRLTQRRNEPVLCPASLQQLADMPGTAAIDLALGLIVLRYTQSNSVALLLDGKTLGIGAGQQSRIDCTALAGSKADTWWLRRHPAVRDPALAPRAGRHERINRQLRFLEDELPAAEREQWLADRVGLSLASDGAIPFRDNVDRAQRHGVRYLAEPGGSARSDEVAAACAEHGITLARTGIRLFHH